MSIDQRPDNEGLLDLAQAACYLGIGPRSMYWLKRTRQVSYYVINRKIRFSRDDLDRYREKARIKAADEE